MFWDDLKAGLTVLTLASLLLILAPFSMGLGLYLMNKLVPQLAPACEVQK